MFLERSIRVPQLSWMACLSSARARTDSSCFSISSGVKAAVFSRDFLFSSQAVWMRAICSARVFCCSAIHSSRDSSSYRRMVDEVSSILPLTRQRRSLISWTGEEPQRSALMVSTSLERELNWSSRSRKDWEKISPSSSTSSAAGFSGLSALVMGLVFFFGAILRINLIQNKREEIRGRGCVGVIMRRVWIISTDVVIIYFQVRMESDNHRNRFFFEFIPINLNKTARKGKGKALSSASLKFALFLQTRKVAESKDWMQLDFIQNVHKCRYSSLDFYIANFNPDFYTNFTLKAIVKEPPRLQMENEPEHEEICRVEEVIGELGGFQLDPGIYIETFKEDHKALYQQNIEISPQYSLDYELYIERTRFGLEKLIRESRGSNSEANILVSAFKKRSGKKRVRYVQFNDSGEHSVKEEDFKRNKKILISSLKKNGKKYVPEKTVEPDSNSSRNMTPVKPQKSNEQSSSLLSQENTFLKIASKVPERGSTSGEQASILQSARLTRGGAFQRSMINPHWSFDSSMIVNRTNYEKCLETFLLSVFWGVALLLLYLSMSPSRKA